MLADFPFMNECLKEGLFFLPAVLSLNALAPWCLGALVGYRLNGKIATAASFI
jgi:hypothetical protein